MVTTLTTLSSHLAAPTDNICNFAAAAAESERVRFCAARASAISIGRRGTATDRRPHTRTHARHKVRAPAPAFDVRTPPPAAMTKLLGRAPSSV